MILADSLYRSVSPLLRQLNSLSPCSLVAALAQLRMAVRLNRNLQCQLLLRLCQHSLIDPRIIPQLQTLRILPQTNQLHRIANYIKDKQLGRQPSIPSTLLNLTNLTPRLLESIKDALTLAMLLDFQHSIHNFIISKLHLFRMPLVELITARVLQEQNQQLLQKFMTKCKLKKYWTQHLKMNLQNKVEELDQELACDWEDPVLFSFFQVWLWQLDVDKYLFVLSDEYRKKFTKQCRFVKNFLQAYRCSSVNPYRVKLQAQALKVAIPESMFKSSTIRLEVRLLSYKDCCRLEQEGWGRQILGRLSKNFKDVSKLNLQAAIFLSDSAQKVKALAEHSERMSQEQKLLFSYKQFAFGLVSQLPARPFQKMLQVQHQKASLLGGVQRLQNLEWSRLAGWLHRNRANIRWPKECRQLQLVQKLSILKESQLQLYKYEGGSLIKAY